MMTFLRPSTVRGAFLPAMLMSWAYGMGVIEYPEGRPRPFISACWSLLHIAGFLSLIKYSRIQKLLNVNGSLLSAHNFQVIVVAFLILVIVCLVTGHAKAKEWRNVLRKIANVNAVLKSFGISEKYDAIFNTQMVELGIVIAITIVVMVVLYIRPKPPSRRKPISYLIPIYYMWSSYIINEWYLTIIVRYMRTRFKHLNDYLVYENGRGQTKSQGLSRNTMVSRNQVLQFAPITFEVHGDPRMIRATNRRWLLRVIRETRKVHRDMVNLLKELNGVYAVQILVSATVTFISTISCAYNLYLSISVHPEHDKKGSVLVKISISMFITLIIGKSWRLVHACATTSSEAQRTGQLIHELVNPNSDEAFRNEVRLFALQLIQNPLHFSGCGFFTVDYKLFQQMTVSIVTFLAILIQMQNIWDVAVHSGDFPDGFVGNGTTDDTN